MQQINKSLETRLEKLGWNYHSQRELTKTYTKRGKIIEFNKRQGSFSVTTWIRYKELN